MSNDFFLKKVKLLVQMHSEGLLGDEVMPEDVLIRIVPTHDLPNVLTLGMSLNYQRDSYKLWQSIVQAYLNESSQWIFHSNTVSKCNLDELRNVLVHYRVALQPNRHPEIWKRVAMGITRSSSNGDVMGLIESVQFDISLLGSRPIMQKIKIGSQ